MKILRKLALALCLLNLNLAYAESTVNLNSADQQTLAAVLLGVGDKKAAAIIEYREQNGPFQSVDELTEVDGIGDSTLEQNRTRLRLSEE